MKKILLLALTTIAAGTALIATSSQASRMMNIVSPGLGSGAPLYTFTVTTPNNSEIRLDEVRLFVGSTCSALVKVGDFYSQGDDYASTESSQDSMTSDNLLEMFGPGLGCFKMDAFYHGKLVTTGPVALTWDASTGQYTAANPSSSNLSF